ncbi:MAG TPA: NADP-dependent oxidoreductase [Acidimicrobiales bacterium]|jgi:NADPH:quinone reductase-like Zn-dependent oxidoreductase
MPRAVRFDHYGDRDVLYLADVPVPVPSQGEVLVRVRAAGINPGEIAIRTGRLDSSFPATFPSGEGSDLAGIVTAVGSEVTAFSVGDEVLGWSWNRSSHADYVVVPSTQLIAKPPALSWEVAGSLYVVGCTAYAAVRAVGVRQADTVAVSAAAGGVGTLVVQLLRRRGATAIGIASQVHHGWLEDHGVVPVAYGDGLEGRLRTAAPNGVDAFIDLFGPEYVELAIALGVRPDRIETIISRDKALEVGAKTEGSGDASTTDVLSEMAELVASGQIELPIAATYPLEKVREAFAELEHRHTLGKIVLIP